MMKQVLGINAHIGRTIPLFFTVFKNAQIQLKIPKNGPILNFSTLTPKNTYFQFILSFKMVSLAIQAIFLEKWRKIQISAFLNDFWKNGSMCVKLAFRNPWDGSNGLFWIGFSPKNMNQVFRESAPEPLKKLQTCTLNEYVMHPLPNFIG